METRFVDKIMKTETCWLWIACCGNEGYGQFWVNKKIIKAHRFAYELWIGKIPAGLCVRHKCDNPKCVRPEHLETGSHQDNMNDMIYRGRCHSKLTKNDIIEIRVLSGFFNQTELGKMYSISQTHISNILNNKRWTKLTL